MIESKVNGISWIDKYEKNHKKDFEIENRQFTEYYL